MTRPTRRKPKEYKYSRYTYKQKHVILQYRDSHTTAETIDRFFSGVAAYAESINVELIKVPPSFTFVCQPADLLLTHSLKVIWIWMTPSLPL
ncbi:hypothetical protein H257_09059 [Aphanomyces astaci]|uniref:Uncharacterized protein n=1 Tax=Aphanomyces astaci TaxID=112090 RepID=W4GE01_APHAT|nr:hypothetical protein H257_09059 [Aphanomyces astaci]ETV77173.1 hypothetical protein H257_09059 [Aphanomyces astaci]|eukprot:XP_009833479.1 hypothetical protein H257_09059 [Aphanomyces astaci]